MERNPYEAYPASDRPGSACSCSATVAIMKSNAATAEQYLASLPDDRRAAVASVRRFILDHLDTGLVECMQYGVIAYCVPLGGKGGWPHGHHTNPKLPLMYMGLSSQKNDMVVYMLFLLHNERERAWFDTAWHAGARGRKNHLEVTGAGCCLRFRKLDDLPLDIIARAMGRMPVTKYLADHVAMLARLGKGPDGKAIKKRAKNSEEKRGTSGGTKANRGTKAKRAAASSSPGKKSVKKKTAARRG